MVCVISVCLMSRPALILRLLEQRRGCHWSRCVWSAEKNVSLSYSLKTSVAIIYFLFDCDCENVTVRKILTQGSWGLGTGGITPAHVKKRVPFARVSSSPALIGPSRVMPLQRHQRVLYRNRMKIGRVGSQRINAVRTWHSMKSK